MAGNEVEIRVVAKDQTGPGFASAERGARGIKGSMLGLGAAAGAAGAAVATLVPIVGSAIQSAVGYFGDATAAASDLAESLSKSNTVFGRQARAVEMWATAAARNVGLAKGAALQAAGTFGNLFDQLGLAEDASADMSTSMVDLAADFASFHNADITEVIEAQSAAFRGEYDSLQRFVPLINAAAVETKALAMTGKDNADELTAQEEALATYTLMMEGAGEAQGDFARTSEGAANQQRIANAEMENANAKIGELLLPLQQLITDLKLGLATTLSEDVVPWLKNLWGEIKGPVTEAFAAMKSWIREELIPALAAFWEWIQENVVPALQAFWQWIRGKVIPVVQQWVAVMREELLPRLAELWGRVQNELIPALRRLWDSVNVGDRQLTGLKVVLGLLGAVALASVAQLGIVVTVITKIADAAAAAMRQINRMKEAVGSIPGGGVLGQFVTGGLVGVVGGLFAHGGIVGAQAGGVRSGLTMVGEHGRELLDIPAGSRVHGNAETERMLAGGGGGRMVLSYEPSGDPIIDHIVKGLRVRIDDGFGGNVQMALGR